MCRISVAVVAWAWLLSGSSLAVAQHSAIEFPEVEGWTKQPRYDDRGGVSRLTYVATVAESTFVRGQIEVTTGAPAKFNDPAMAEKLDAVIEKQLENPILKEQKVVKKWKFHLGPADTAPKAWGVIVEGKHSNKPHQTLLVLTTTNDGYFLRVEFYGPPADLAVGKAAMAKLLTELGSVVK